MGGYAKTGPFVNATTPPGISASFLNAVESVLARGVGDTETGKYVLSGWGSTNTDHISHYMSSISRTSVPINVTIDTVDVAPSNINSPTTALLTANGFQVFSTPTGATINASVAGNSTIQY